MLPFIPQAQIFACRPFTETTKFLSDGVHIESLQAVHLPGHTLDSYGFLDLRTNSLISGDAIQLWGIGDFGVNAESPRDYLQSHEKLLKMPIENIFSSHYYDFLGIRTIGKKESDEYVKESAKNYQTLIEFVKENIPKTTNAQELCSIFANEHENYPKMQPYAVEQIIKYIQA